MRTKRRSPPQRLALGAVAGFGATLVLQGIMQLSGKIVPDAKPPIKQDPGVFMVNKLTSLMPESARERIPDAAKAAAAKSLHLGYGVTSGVVYGAVRPGGGSVFADGSLLGLGVWAAGYLGWLPATDLMPPIHRHDAQQIIAPIVQHALFGIAVVTAYDSLMRIK